MQVIDVNVETLSSEIVVESSGKVESSQSLPYQNMEGDGHRVLEEEEERQDEKVKGFGFVDFCLFTVWFVSLGTFHVCCCFPAKRLF